MHVHVDFISDITSSSTIILSLKSTFIVVYLISDKLLSQG